MTTDIFKVDTDFKIDEVTTMQNFRDTGNGFYTETNDRRFYVGFKEDSGDDYVIILCTDLSDIAIYQLNIGSSNIASYTFDVTSSNYVHLTLVYSTGSTRVPHFFTFDETGTCVLRRAINYTYSGSASTKRFRRYLGEEYMGVVPFITTMSYANLSNGISVMRVSDGYCSTHHHFINFTYTKNIISMYERFSKPGLMVGRIRARRYHISNVYFKGVVRISHDENSFTTHVLNFSEDNGYDLKNICVDDLFNVTYVVSFTSNSSTSAWPNGLHDTHFNLIETWPAGASTAEGNRQRRRVLYRNDKSATFDTNKIWEDSDNLNLEIEIDGVYRIFSFNKVQLDEMETDPGKASLQLPYDLILCTADVIGLLDSNQSGQFTGSVYSHSDHRSSISWSASNSGGDFCELATYSHTSMNSGIAADAGLFQDLVITRDSPSQSFPQFTVEPIKITPTS